MNVQEQVNPQEAAQQIWSQIDAEEAGNATPPEPEYRTNDGARADAYAEQTAEQAVEQGDEAEAAPADPLQDKISGLEAQLNQALHRLRQAEGHIGGLNSQLKQQLQAAQQVASKGGDAPTAKEIAAAQQDPEAMSNLKRDYPEFATAMEAALESKLAQMKAQLQPQQVQQQQQPSVGPGEIQRLKAEFAVEVRHPGWQTTVQTPEFLGWLNRQPRELHMLAASDSPQDAIRLLDVYADALKPVASQRTQRLNAAAAIPSGRAGASVRQKAVEDLSPQEYWRYLDELDKQKG